MKNIIRFFVFVSPIFLSVISYAATYGDCTNCEVSSIGTGAHYDGYCTTSSCAVIQVKHDENGSFTPSDANCGSTSWQFVLDTSTDSGKTTLSQLLTAFASGKKVGIGGNSICNAALKAENIRFVYFTSI